LTVLDEKGEPYTDLSVAQIIYDLADKDMNETKIAKSLNEKHVPTGREAYWHLSSVANMLADEYVIGKAAVFVHRTENKPGVKKLTKARPKEEWVYLPEGVVPPILVTEDGKPDIALFERVQQRKGINKDSATRNNPNPESYLLRGGYVRCGYCGRGMKAANLGNEEKPRLEKATR
jgi:site-specific DNA recombinase